MIGQMFLNRYQATRFLGQGSMGAVYLAKTLSSGSPVVVKVIHPHVAAEPGFRQFFDSEIESLTQLRHPCVVGLLDAAFNDAHGPCLIMEYIPGLSLETILEKNGFLTADQANFLLIPLCRALMAGHARRIVHRDLKPANLMVTDPASDTPSLKVMDFGLALLNAKPHISLDKLRGQSVQATTFGTPLYVAPDGLRGDATDHRVDLYSVGVILFELLIGVPPFNYTTTLSILNAHMKERPPKFSAVRPDHDVPPEAEAVVRQCLEKYPNERPQTAREIAVAFGRAVGAPLTEDRFPIDEGQAEPPIKAKARANLSPGGMFRVVHTLDAWMPEPIAVVKLRGFVESAGGEICDSQPGEIRVQLGRTPKKVPVPPRSHSLLKWAGEQFGAPPLPPPEASSEDPVDLRLYLSHANDRANELQMMIVFQPIEGSTLAHPERWRSRCDSLFHDLRGYLIAK